MLKALKSLSLFGGLAVVLTLFLVIGCSNKNPIQPMTADPDPPDLFRPPPVGPDPSSIIEEFDAGLINKITGGIIEIERGEYLHEFEVQPGAIRQSTLITIRSINEQVLGEEMIVFEFGPDGLQFSESSKLRFDMAELNGSANTGYLYYYDPVRKQWSLQSFANVGVSGIVEFDIDHFSKYAISD
jgi:hypothetical protein